VNANYRRRELDGERPAPRPPDRGRGPVDASLYSSRSTTQALRELRAPIIDAIEPAD